jgi:hypothetical protein
VTVDGRDLDGAAATWHREEEERRVLAEAEKARQEEQERLRAEEAARALREEREALRKLERTFAIRIEGVARVDRPAKATAPHPPP